MIKLSRRKKAIYILADASIRRARDQARVALALIDWEPIRARVREEEERKVKLAEQVRRVTEVIARHEANDARKKEAERESAERAERVRREDALVKRERRKLRAKEREVEPEEDCGWKCGFRGKLSIHKCPKMTQRGREIKVLEEENWAKTTGDLYRSFGRPAQGASREIPIAPPPTRVEEVPIPNIRDRIAALRAKVREAGAARRI